jgi:hypothetical protein
MFSLAKVSIRPPKAMLAAWLLVAAGLTLVGLGVSKSLSPTITVVPGPQSARAERLAGAKFGPTQQIKQFAILDRDLTQAHGELTPTLNVKRAVVYERYADLFNGLYEDGGIS